MILEAWPSLAFTERFRYFLESLPIFVIGVFGPQILAPYFPLTLRPFVILSGEKIQRIQLFGNRIEPRWTAKLHFGRIARATYHLHLYQIATYLPPLNQFTPDSSPMIRKVGNERTLMTPESHRTLSRRTSSFLPL